MDMGTSFIWQYWVETILMISTRSLDLAARNSHQNAHVSTLVAALEPQPPGPQTIRLNGCLPTSQGFYAPAKERQGLELLVVVRDDVNTKDRCEACDITKGEATLYHKGLRRTLCARDVNSYKRNGHLAPKDISCDWRLADHCESCGTTEARLCQLHDLHITVCRREYETCTYFRTPQTSKTDCEMTIPSAERPISTIAHQ